MSSAAASAWHRSRTRLLCPEEGSRCLRRCPHPSKAARRYRAPGHMTPQSPVHGPHRRSPPDYGGVPPPSLVFSLVTTFSLWGGTPVGGGVAGKEAPPRRGCPGSLGAVAPPPRPRRASLPAV